MGRRRSPGRRPKFCPNSGPVLRETFVPSLRLHRGLEILTPQWQDLLDEALATPLTPCRFAAADAQSDLELRNLGTYYLLRYWFQAVSDFDPLLKLQKLAAAWAVTRYLEAVHWSKTGTLSQTYRIRLHQLYSKEVEHDGENEATLEEACLSNLAFSLESLRNLI